MLGEGMIAAAGEGKTRPWIGAELKALTGLAIPIAAANLAEMAMVLTNMVMMGRLGAATLAAGGLGGNLLWCVTVIPLGIMMAVGAVAAHASGGGNRRAVGRAAGQGLVIAAVLSLPTIAALWWTGPVIAGFGADAEVAPLLREYLRAICWCVPAILGFSVLQRFVSALFRPRLATVISVIAIALNALANEALIFGRFGLPALGVAGSGWATTLVCWAEFLSLAAVVALTPYFRHYRPFGGAWPPHRPTLREILTVGWPIGGSMAVESWFFLATGFLVWHFGTTALAAHQVAVSFSSISYMIVLALSHAATYRVAHALGARAPLAARRSGTVSIVASLAFMGIVGLGMWVFAEPIVGIYLDLDEPANQPVLPIAITLIGIAALFQIADGLQCVAAGALRGLKDTRATFIAALVGYWVAGLGSGLGLGFALDLGPAGLWIGLAVGLAAAGMVLTWRFHRKSGALLAALPAALPAAFPV
ncbi:MAG: MATE family efflux transporter [Pseudomonadota bacterium]